jgi:hypothetical protein
VILNRITSLKEDPKKVWRDSRPITYITSQIV